MFVICSAATGVSTTRTLEFLGKALIARAPTAVGICRIKTLAQVGEVHIVGKCKYTHVIYSCATRAQRTALALWRDVPCHSRTVEGRPCAHWKGNSVPDC